MHLGRKCEGGTNRATARVFAADNRLTLLIVRFCRS